MKMRKSTVLLCVIYLTFISLGLPDSLLGAAWPVMQKDLAAPVFYAGIVAMIITGGTILSSLFSQRLIGKFGTGKLTLISVLMTAVALWGFGVASSFFWLCFWAVPLGLGAGAVDAALNHFVALHYASRHMNWLHCFWGIGATMGPMIMSLYLLANSGWNIGYQVISGIQFGLVLILVASLALWATSKIPSGGTESNKSLKLTDALQIKGARVALTGFFSYCALEATVGLWSGSFLVSVKQIQPELAARWVSMFYLGITLGRLTAGFAAIKFKNNEMINMGQKIIAVGIVLLIISDHSLFLPVGLLLIGLGCAPVYPCMLHNTPMNFGKELSQTMMGIQMAFAYMGAAFMPAFFGVAANGIGVVYFPIYILLLLIVMVISTRKLAAINKKTEDS